MAGEVDGGSQYQGKKRALIISISQYDKLEPLEFCEKDGSKMYEVLKQLDYDIPVKYRLIGGRVEYDSLRDSILDFFSDPFIRPKDTILFYFSGHGVLGDDGEHYLSTSQIDPDRPRRRGFSFDDLSKAREECNSKTIFTVLDCCYSGSDTPGSKGSDDKASEAKELLKNKSKILGEGKCILTACKPMQKAYEYKEQGHSFFTYYLTEALSSQVCADEDGNVTPYMLSEYIDNRIRSLAPEIRPKQTPLLNCSTSGKIILARITKAKIKAPDESRSSAGNASVADTAIIDALEYLTNGDYTNALSCLDKALEIDHNNAKAYHYKGNIFAKLEKYQEAMECYQKALEIDPNPKYAAAVSKVVGMIKTYMLSKEKGSEQVAEHIQQNIQESIDDDSTNKTLDSIKGTNTLNTHKTEAVKQDPNVVATKVITLNTPSWLPKAVVDEDLIKMLQVGRVSEFNMVREKHPNQSLRLNGADLRGTKLRGVNLRKADLPLANFKDADLQDADLRDANLLDVSFVRASLARANLQGAVLNGADFAGTDLSQTNLAAASLFNAKLSKAKLDKKDKEYAKSRGAIVEVEDTNRLSHEDQDLNSPDPIGIKNKTIEIRSVLPSNQQVSLRDDKGNHDIVDVAKRIIDVINDYDRALKSGKKERAAKARIVQLIETNGVSEIYKNMQNDHLDGSIELKNMIKAGEHLESVGRYYDALEKYGKASLLSAATRNLAVFSPAINSFTSLVNRLKGIKG